MEPCFKAIHTHEIPLHLKASYDALNVDQQNAIKHLLKYNDYALTLGMPGTSKSESIVVLLPLLMSFVCIVLLLF